VKTDAVLQLDIPWRSGRIYETRGGPDSLPVNGPVTRAQSAWRPWKRLRRGSEKWERVEGVGEAGRGA
jgi:hypothetical protein